jgi:benzoyl-CoA reductase/2-hydroxyglutaryl-CoA dehydratase subunit BcrC/BadD/HgdB
MLIPREEHNRLLEELLSKIEKGERRVDQRLRIVVVGHPCAVPEDGLLDLIEDLGMVIIDDDFFSGGRYFALDVNADGDPVESIADYYMNAIPCTTRHFPGNWVDGSNKYSPYADYVMDMVTRGQARGVVLIREMYCDPFDMEFVLLKQRMEDEHVPYLALITEHGLGPVEPIRTRVQAFDETLRRG